VRAKIARFGRPSRRLQPAFAATRAVSFDTIGGRSFARQHAFREVDELESELDPVYEKQYSYLHRIVKYFLRNHI
jgi:hypothetical protein